MAATYVLVLAPTRELAVQVHSMIQRLAQFTDIQAALVVGGLSLQAQATALRAAPEIVVATPVRRRVALLSRRAQPRFPSTVGWSECDRRALPPPPLPLPRRAG